MFFVYILGNVFCFLEERPMNPEAHMNISQVISYWGYPSEMYEVLTEDGYILPVYRIPHGKNNSSGLAQKPAVYLQHGLTLTARIWIANPPNNSLGFLLADAGCDVWLGNSRGNTWSRKHLYLDPDSKEFWDFSFDKIIKYDLPAITDFIVKKTGQKQIYYVGHSQGTILAFGAFATNPQLAQKIKINFALGPVATAKYVTSILRVLTYIEPTMFKNLCQRETMGTVCNNVLTLLMGYNPKNLNESRLDMYLGELQSGTSVQNFLHYAQAVHNGTFQAYDWGSPSLNILHYKQPIPPLYNVEDMEVPTAMWSGGQDSLADPIDVKNLELKISNLIYHKKIPSYSHLDFVIGLDAFNEVFSEIISFIHETEGV